MSIGKNKIELNKLLKHSKKIPVDKFKSFNRYEANLNKIFNEQLERFRNLEWDYIYKNQLIILKNIKDNLQNSAVIKRKDIPRTAIVLRYRNLYKYLFEGSHSYYLLLQNKKTTEKELVNKLKKTILKIYGKKHSDLIFKMANKELKNSKFSFLSKKIIIVILMFATCTSAFASGKSEKVNYKQYFEHQGVRSISDLNSEFMSPSELNKHFEIMQFSKTNSYFLNYIGWTLEEEEINKLEEIIKEEHGVTGKLGFYSSIISYFEKEGLKKKKSNNHNLKSTAVGLSRDCKKKYHGKVFDIKEGHYTEIVTVESKNNMKIRVDNAGEFLANNRKKDIESNRDVYESIFSGYRYLTRGIIVANDGKVYGFYNLTFKINHSSYEEILYKKNKISKNNISLDSFSREINETLASYEIIFELPN